MQTLHKYPDHLTPYQPHLILIFHKSSIKVRAHLHDFFFHVRELIVQVSFLVFLLFGVDLVLKFVDINLQQLESFL